MKKVYVLVVAIVMALSSATAVKAQVEVSAGADVVSSYVWRGLVLGGPSIQPGISASYSGFTLGVWGSSSLAGSNTIFTGGPVADEFDLYLNYGVGNFSATITDYAFPSTLTEYTDYKTHTFELTLAYTISEEIPLTLAWNTNFAGADDWDGDDKNDFSSYFEAGYSLPFESAGLTLDLALGLTPWKGAYSDGFALHNISAKASKEIAFTDKFSLPVFGQAIVNPDAKTAFFVFGISF